MVVPISFARKGTHPVNRQPISTPSAHAAKGFLLVLATAVLLAACQPGTNQATPNTVPAASTAPTAAPGTVTSAPTATSAATATVAITASTSAVTVAGDDGTTVTLAANPQKVISLTPATSELMFALGAGDRLVGRTDYDDFPADVSEVPAVATFQGVEMEKVVDIGPDLVLAGGNGFTPAADIQRMRDLGFPVLVLYAEDVSGVQDDIRLVGQAVDEEDAAAQIVAAIQDRIDEVTLAVAELPKPRTFYEIGNDPELYGPAPGSFVADMVTLAGGDPITTTDPAVFSIPVERLVSLDPEVIVLGDAAYGVCPDSVAARPGWKSITAIKNDDVRPVNDTIVTRPGPRIGEGLAALALTIHPDAAIAAPADATALCAVNNGSPSPS
jgi:iron complex transport system substrate-binding protein